MADIDLTYKVGKATIAANGTAVTGTSTFWDIGANVRQWDFISINNSPLMPITSVTDATHLTVAGYTGAAQAAVNYVIYQCSPLRYVGGQAMASVNAVLGKLAVSGLVWYLSSSYTDPTQAGWNADEGQYAYQASSGKYWVVNGGVWTLTGQPNGAPGLALTNTFTGVNTFGTTAIFNGQIDSNSAADASISSSSVGAIVTNGGIYVTKTLVANQIQMGNTLPQFNSKLSIRLPGTNIEFGHSNTAGYGSSIGCDQSAGTPWLIFYGTAGTNTNTYRTYGYRAGIMKPDGTGGFLYQTVASANADNQSGVNIAALDGTGKFRPTALGSLGATLPLDVPLIATANSHQFGVNSGSLYDQPKLQSEANILLYNLSSTNWAGLGSDTSGHVWIKTGTAGSPAAAFVVRADRTIAMPVYGAGSMSTNASGVISVSSDERLKDVDGIYKGGLSEIMQLRPIIYKWKKDQPMYDNVTYVGFGANAVHKVIPEATGTDDKGFRTLGDRAIIAALVNSVQELNNKIEALAA